MGDKLKFGFDLHGVLDDLPKTFKVINNSLYDSGHEIHIITGSHITKDIEDELHEIGIKYHKIFGIADYHREIGTEIKYDELGRPWLDEEEWNRTKGDYCRREGIDLHFDDSDVYNDYFTTPFSRVWTKNDRNGRGCKKKMSAFKEKSDKNL